MGWFLVRAVACRTPPICRRRALRWFSNVRYALVPHGPKDAARARELETQDDCVGLGAGCFFERITPDTTPQPHQ